MKHSLVKQRYAKSLLDLALDLNQVEEVHADMQLLLAIAADSRDLTMMLRSPIIKPDYKIAVFTKLFDGKMSNLTMQFMALLAKKKREELLVEIADKFLSLYKEHRGIKTAYLSTAKELNPEVRDRVVQRLKSQTGAEVELIEKVEDDLIGGFVLRMDDKQIDASMRGALKKIAREFDENLYTKAF
ncbi:MAG: ATP synthase F1 subunit delta [Flavobacteriales bacterium]|nr:ATP synthase F1 subunit delta [Flavobacteriales bacterium]